MDTQKQKRTATNLGGKSAEFIEGYHQGQKLATSDPDFAANLSRVKDLLSDYGQGLWAGREDRLEELEREMMAKSKEVKTIRDTGSKDQEHLGRDIS